ncbi:uncharacterized protein LOC141865880 isoform X2 [Acropora palmata]|uniref:uncharacterized protein LOC141865880 isoform X2 n=1 Tax=Acropora palmata TaxID=6131 RepID=UPI003DA0A8FA
MSKQIPRQHLKSRSQEGVVWTDSVFGKIHRCSDQRSHGIKTEGKKPCRGQLVHGDVTLRQEQGKFKEGLAVLTITGIEKERGAKT